MMHFKNISYEKEARIGTITISRPEVKNAINRETLEELEALVKELEKDEDLMVLILTGGGEEAFISGGDLKYLRSLETIHDGRNFSLRGQALLNSIENLDIPVIAAINGYALGGGCEVALACDMRIASERATFSFRQAKMGIMTGWGGALRLLRLVGRAQCLQLLLTGKTLSAQEALRIGLADMVVPHEEVTKAALQLATEITKNAPLSIRFIKRLVNHGAEMPLKEGINYEAELFCTLWTSYDHREAESAFFEKRNPKFEGR